LIVGIAALASLFVAGILVSSTPPAMDLLGFLSLILVTVAAVWSAVPLFDRVAHEQASGLVRAGRFAALAIAAASGLLLLGQVADSLFPFESEWGLLGSLAALTAGTLLTLRFAALDQPLTRERIVAREILLVTAISISTVIVLPVVDVDLRWGTFLAVAGGAYWSRWVVWAARVFLR
jgi:hypothetical protein